MTRSRHRRVTGPTEKQRRGEQRETLPLCTRGDVVRHYGTAPLRVCQARPLTTTLPALCVRETACVLLSLDATS